MTNHPEVSLASSNCTFEPLRLAGSNNYALKRPSNILRHVDLR